MDIKDRIVSAAIDCADMEIETTVRPRRLADLIGRDKISEGLDVFMQAARQRGDPLDHVLLYGPPGLGKTTLANIIGNEMEAPVRTTSGPAIERPGDLASVLTNLEPGSVLFIDEIHRLNRAVEEILYPAMEDFQLDLIIGKGPAARTLRIDLPKFTLIGATTRTGMITPPLRARFGIVYNFEFYDVDSLATIVRRSARILGVPITENAAYEIASRSRGTPRIANRILRRVRDYAEVRADGTVDLEIAKAALDMLEIDEIGLDSADRRLLQKLIEEFEGGPVGIETLAAISGEERDTIEDAIEPYLMQIAFLKRTTRGRVATRKAYDHMRYSIPINLQERLPVDQLGLSERP